MPLFDSHCHFDFSAFSGRQSDIWQQCRTSGIQWLTIPGVCPGQWPKAAALAGALPGVFYACGLHPWWLADYSGDEDTLAKSIGDFTGHYRPVALGECGLDAAIATDMQRQQRFFERQIQLACELSLPLIIHVRKTHNLTLRLLKKYRPARGGVIHGFSGSPELAQQYWREGFYLGIGGIITYPRARKTIATAKALPLEALLLETDAPDMPPNGEQGKANSPLNVLKVAESLAQLRNDSVTNIARQTSANAHQLFASHADV